MTKDEQKRLDAVMEDYPAFKYRIDGTRVHERVVLLKDEQPVGFITKSKSSSCRHAFKNFIGDVKRTLRSVQL